VRPVCPFLPELLSLKICACNYKCFGGGGGGDDDDDDDDDDATWREMQPDSLEQSRGVAEILRPVVVVVRMKLYLHHVI